MSTFRLDNHGPVARDFQPWIAGASNVGLITGGEWSGHHCIGCSLVVNPEGEPVLRGPCGHEAPALLCVDVTLAAHSERADGWHQTAT